MKSTVLHKDLEDLPFLECSVCIASLTPPNATCCMLFTPALPVIPIRFTGGTCNVVCPPAAGWRCGAHL